MNVDALIVGGGFYGTSIAAYLKKQRGLQRVLLVEQDNTLLNRASYNNQARVHNGYHYPRSLTTAVRSRINLPRFMRDYPQAVKRDFTAVYAIARRNSKVNARQFTRFCNEIGAVIAPAPVAVAALFDPRLIEAVFLVEEYIFDAVKLAENAAQTLAQAGVEVHLGSMLTAVEPAAGNSTSSPNSPDSSHTLQAVLREREGAAESLITVNTRYLFNCTYSGLNRLRGSFPGTATGLKHEITEMALLEVPPALTNLGVTVMDGPFFSLMPFPAIVVPDGANGAGEPMRCTLSHVRYTPHQSWMDSREIDPYQRLSAYDKVSRADRMLRDAARYMPALAEARQAGSLFEVKTVLAKSETDDGRPILFESHPALPGCYSILGGKIDNIYDVFDRLDAEHLP